MPAPNFVKLQRSCRNGRYVPTKGCLATGNGGLSQKTVGVGDKDGVIIVDHGSRRKESNLMLNEFVAMFRDKTGYMIVEPAYMDLNFNGTGLGTWAVDDHVDVFGGSDLGSPDTFWMLAKKLWLPVLFIIIVLTNCRLMPRRFKSKIISPSVLLKLN